MLPNVFIVKEINGCPIFKYSIMKQMTSASIRLWSKLVKWYFYGISSIHILYDLSIMVRERHLFVFRDLNYRGSTEAASCNVHLIANDWCDQLWSSIEFLCEYSRTGHDLRNDDCGSLWVKLAFIKPQESSDLWAGGRKITIRLVSC